MTDVGVMAGTARGRRRELSRTASIPARALAVLSRQARRLRHQRRPRRPRRFAAHRQARAQGDVQRREPVRRAALRRSAGNRAYLLDERNHRHAELHPAHRGRSRQLGDRFGTQLCGLGHLARRPRDHHVQRRAVRRRRGARCIRADRREPHPGRHRLERAPAARDRPAASGCSRTHAVIRRVPARARRSA